MGLGVPPPGDTPFGPAGLNGPRSVKCQSHMSRNRGELQLMSAFRVRPRARSVISDCVHVPFEVPGRGSLMYFTLACLFRNISTNGVPAGGGRSFWCPPALISDSCRDGCVIFVTISWAQHRGGGRRAGMFSGPLWTAVAAILLRRLHVPPVEGGRGCTQEVSSALHSRRGKDAAEVWLRLSNGPCRGKQNTT